MGKKKYLLAALLILSAVLLWVAFCGYAWSWGPFYTLHDLKTTRLAGNQAEYGLDQVPRLPDSPLQGKTLIFLGSSVTYGAASKRVSFVEYVQAGNGCTAVKEAVSGTTLAGRAPNSYISRMKRLQVREADLFVCQLSTNDATQNKPLGAVGPQTQMEEFDIETVAGAIEYIIAYAQETWHCPVVFYTNPRYDSENYAAMVRLLLEIKEKWGIRVIDLWSDTPFNQISEEERALYMADPIHPTQAGYWKWWLPKMEPVLWDAVDAA